MVTLSVVIWFYGTDTDLPIVTLSALSCFMEQRLTYP